MTRRAFIPVVLILFAVVFLRLAAEYTELRHLRPLAAFYVTQAPIELGVANIVTAILITYRGFDTLGEVAVLFMVAASVGMLLTQSETAPGTDEAAKDLAARSSEIVTSAAQILLPLILVFGAYVIVNGHLSAGGSFRGRRDRHLRSDAATACPAGHEGQSGGAQHNGIAGGHPLCLT